MSQSDPRNPQAAHRETSPSRTPQRWPHTAERSLSTGDHDMPQAALCADNHRALKMHEATWQAARFGGYQPLGFLLGEQRDCPVCGSSVVRLVPFTAALLHVLEHLFCQQQPSETYLHAASMLASWAQKNLPAHLGIIAGPAPRNQPALPDKFRDEDWQQLGQEVRRRREQAGLSRAQLSALSGVATSTIHRCETGRHRPTASTLQRLYAAPPFLSADLGRL